MESKYDLVEPTAEELKAFYKDLEGILNLHSIYIEPVPAYTRKAIGEQFTASASLFIQKKVKRDTAK